MNDAATIGPLTKVSLLLTITAPDAAQSPSGNHIEFDFICGLAIEGLTAFEKDLLGKAPGDTACIQVEPFGAEAYFEHLMCPLLDSVEARPPFALGIEVRSVTPASDRELMRALATKSGMDGCGGDCGCGCGGH